MDDENIFEIRLGKTASKIFNVMHFRSDSRIAISSWNFARIEQSNDIQKAVDYKSEDEHLKNLYVEKNSGCKRLRSDKQINNLQDMSYTLKIGKNGTCNFKGKPIGPNGFYTFYMFVSTAQHVMEVYKIVGWYNFDCTLYSKPLSIEVEYEHELSQKVQDYESITDKSTTDSQIEKVSNRDFEHPDLVEEIDNSPQKVKNNVPTFKLKVMEDEESEVVDTIEINSDYNWNTKKFNGNEDESQLKNDLIYNELKNFSSQPKINQSRLVESFGYLETLIQRYLIRKPITSRCLFIKCKKKLPQIEQTSLSKNIAAILKKLKPKTEIVQGKLHFSIE